MAECIRCLYDEKIPGISFNQKGLCSYCQLHNEMDEQFPNDKRGLIILRDLVTEIKEKQKNKQYDVVVGISGGCDSSYLLHIAVEKYGLRTATFHYDNGFDSDISKGNMAKMVDKLRVPLWTKKVNKYEMANIYKAFIIGGVKDLEAPTDIGLTKVSYEAANRFDTKYIFCGHSFRTEGIAPLGWSYMDGRYIKDVCKKFGPEPFRFETFPNLYLHHMLWYSLRGYKRLRPLYYLPYNKEEVKEVLRKEYNWEWYGGHHMENIITVFFVTYYRYLKFGFDSRLVEYSALIRDGQMTKPQAYRLLKAPIECPWEVFKQVSETLGIGIDDLLTTGNGGIRRTCDDFKNYKKTFHLLKPLFWLMYRQGMVPKSFYIKYCK